MKALNEGPCGFADLKKKLGIESSGYLQHHLSKLGSLVKTDDYGKYALSDQGKDALLSVETVEKVAESKPRTTSRIHVFKKNVLLKSAVVILALLLVATSVLLAFEYNQATHQAASFQNSIGERNTQISQLSTSVSQLNTAVDWAKAALFVKPAHPQYLATLPESGPEGNQTKIFLESADLGFSYNPFPYNAVLLKENGSTFVEDVGWWAFQYSWASGDLVNGTKVLMIGATVRNDYTPEDAGIGINPSGPIGNLSGRYLSFLSLTVRLYTSNGSIVQAEEANLRSAPTIIGGEQFVLGIGETKDVVFYLIPSELDITRWSTIDHYEIFVSYLSSVPQH